MEAVAPTVTAASVPPELEKEPLTKVRELPAVSTSTSPAYIHGLALASSRASCTDALNLVFEAEKRESKSLDSLDAEDIQKLIYNACVNRLHDKISRGAFIAEAASFAAVACWELLESNNYPKAAQLDEIAKQKPTYAEFVAKQEECKKRHLYPYCQTYWHLCLMARDPTVPYVPGAVRAVMVPFVEKFTEKDHLPIWLEAGNEQARDVYAHFGFRELEKVVVNGVPTWMMMRSAS